MITSNISSERVWPRHNRERLSRLHSGQPRIVHYGLRNVAAICLPSLGLGFLGGIREALMLAIGNPDLLRHLVFELLEFRVHLKFGLFARHLVCTSSAVLVNCLAELKTQAIPRWQACIAASPIQHSHLKTIMNVCVQGILSKCSLYSQVQPGEPVVLMHCLVNADFVRRKTAVNRPEQIRIPLWRRQNFLGHLIGFFD